MSKVEGIRCPVCGSGLYTFKLSLPSTESSFWRIACDGCFFMYGDFGGEEEAVERLARHSLSPVWLEEELESCQEKVTECFERVETLEAQLAGNAAQMQSDRSVLEYEYLKSREFVKGFMAYRDGDGDGEEPGDMLTGEWCVGWAWAAFDDNKERVVNQSAIIGRLVKLLERLRDNATPYGSAIEIDQYGEARLDGDAWWEDMLDALKATELEG